MWRFLLPEREKYFAKFIEEYEKIRRAEGRGSEDPAFYLELPFQDLTGRFSEDWRIRRISYLVLVNEVLNPFHKLLGRPLKILDLGAGNGWLSNRLTQLGQQVVAVDLMTNDFDGLGVCRFYPDPFVAVQAEFDRLPFADALFDLAVFNASFHYSEDYEVTLREALRVLDREARLVILDSPVYRKPESGRAMVKEREHYFEATFGFPSNALQSEHFLSEQRLDELAREFDLRWQILTPNYGWKWRLKPLLAKIRLQREPARFYVIVGRRR